MADPWEEVRREIVEVARETLKGFVETPAVELFTQARADLYARYYWAWNHAPSQEGRDAGYEQLIAARERVKPDFNALHLNIDVDAKNTVIRVYEAIGGMLIRVFPKARAAA